MNTGLVTNLMNHYSRAYGIVASGQQIDQLRPKQCPNCSEPNKVDSRFCSKCRMILSYDAYNDTLEIQKEERSNWQEIRKDLDRLEKMFNDAKYHQ